MRKNLNFQRRMAVKFWGHYSTTQIREKSKKCDCILFPLIFLQRYNKYNPTGNHMQGEDKAEADRGHHPMVANHF